MKIVGRILMFVVCGISIYLGISYGKELYSLISKFETKNIVNIIRYCIVTLIYATIGLSSFFSFLLGKGRLKYFVLSILAVAMTIYLLVTSNLEFGLPLMFIVSIPVCYIISSILMLFSK